jgi:hypothetical protein
MVEQRLRRAAEERVDADCESRDIRRAEKWKVVTILSASRLQLVDLREDTNSPRPPSHECGQLCV